MDGVTVQVRETGTRARLGKGAKRIWCAWLERDGAPLLTTRSYGWTRAEAIVVLRRRLARWALAVEEKGSQA